MGMHGMAMQFIRIVEEVRTVDDLAAAMQAVTAELGFQYFALTHHVDILAAEGAAIRLHNYPTKWADYYDRNALGVSDPVVMFRHILPNAMVATLTFLPFILSGSVTVLASLDFLGYGLPPGSPSLGELVNQGKNNLTAPWLAMTGFVVLGGMLTLLIFVGEAVRDAFDPRKLPGGSR